MISTVHQVMMTRIDSRQGEISIKHLVVDRYNQGMGGVDKADQYAVYYSIERKSKKWWRKLVFWLLEVAIMNSYILYKETVVSLLSHVDYR